LRSMGNIRSARLTDCSRLSKRQWPWPRRVRPGPPGNANTGKRSGSWTYHRRSVFSGGGCCTIRCLQSFELKRRHIAKESFCEYCGDPEETLYHVAIQCPLARRFWAEVKKVEGVTIPNFHPSTWATDVLQPEFCNSKTAALVVCGA